ncbi:FHA domain-containing protein [uncultured Psychrosphaera sp.]|jgi:hypothetical protein|uniref:FHA domain-containing protein n=1 Tax=uncultured Psychrosphaera sp. TaxID=1403522 RepID=UPI00261DF68F|nr:FHA domain-containing protein [uncultured Psychrosphaera sp.]
MEIVIELLTRNNKVKSFHKLSGDSIKIGRSYENDFVLHDEHISPHHAEIIQSEIGSLVLIDKCSVNGIRDKKNKDLGSQANLKSGDVLTIGKHLLRIVLPHHPVAETKKMNALEDITNHLNQWYLAFIAALVFFSSMVVKSYFSTIGDIIWTKVFATSLLVTIALMLFPLFIAIFARVFKKEVRFFTAVVFSFTMFLAWQITTALGQVLLFNWGDSSLVNLGADVVEFVMMVLFFCGCFYLASNMSVKRLCIVSCSLVISIAALFHFSSQDDGKVQLYPVSYAVVLPPAMLVTTAISTEQSIVNFEALFESASRESIKRNKEADEHE